MNISHYCIDRPIFASVISIVITLGGALTMLALPVAQYPDITRPQITVSATYLGADAEVVANNVAAPLEQQINGADNMIYMNSSSSSTGNLTINGMLGVTAIAVFFIPMFYYLLESMSSRSRGGKPTPGVGKPGVAVPAPAATGPATGVRQKPSAPRKDS
jgi:AcrB/AcrD/AcrF family